MDPDLASRRQQNYHDTYLLRVYSVKILLMMDSGHVRNMQSTLSNRFQKQCISLAFIIRIYHDARSSECQTDKFLAWAGKRFLSCTAFSQVTVSTELSRLLVKITNGEKLVFDNRSRMLNRYKTKSKALPVPNNLRRHKHVWSNGDTDPSILTRRNQQR